MSSDLEKFFRGLFQLLGALREQFGVLAWVVLGALLVLGIACCILILRWLRRGGLAPGYSRRFFIERGEERRWLKDRDGVPEKNQ